MHYHHLRGVDHGCSWPKFFALMFMFDALFIVLFLFGVRLYHNYMAEHDVQTIKAWCQTVLCVQIDPNTGVGTPAVPELVPKDQPARETKDPRIQEI